MKPSGNAFVRKLACSVSWKMSSSVFPRVASPFPQFALLHSVTCVQLGLITILGNCGCQFPWCTLAKTAQQPDLGLNRLFHSTYFQGFCKIVLVYTCTCHACSPFLKTLDNERILWQQLKTGIVEQKKRMRQPFLGNSMDKTFLLQQ
jgi:hypothetical protein